jgi:hypothetical protein
VRAPTLAAHAETLAYFTDHLIAAARSADLEEIEAAVEEIRAFQPPDGFDPVTALAVVLAAQIPPSVSVETRLAWVRQLDPAWHEAVAA